MKPLQPPVLQRCRYAASLDYLGENVSSTGDAQHSRDAYLEIYERIAQEKLNANVSCKLTQLGLDLT